VDEKAAIAANQLQKEPGNPTRLLALVETLPYTAPNPVRGKGIEKSSFVQTLLLGYNRGQEPRQHRRGRRIASGWSPVRVPYGRHCLATPIALKKLYNTRR